ARVAREAVEAGAEIINDITALAGDAAMPQVARETQAGVCAMHMQGTPQTMQDNPSYADVVADVLAYLRERRRSLVAAGIDPERLALDPGIGFGKTHQHNVTLLSHCDRFHELGSPLVVGPSRKGFIAKILQDKQADRTAGTIGVALSLASQGVQIIRVHDVEPVRQALLLFEATGGIER
ncbi:MAG TPA: dihydropteroate synthase, partial [Pirellulales bacterium]|nr:dihydropteroate synthase [Pirellulales bacterium]